MVQKLGSGPFLWLELFTDGEDDIPTGTADGAFHAHSVQGFYLLHKQNRSSAHEFISNTD